MLLKLQFFTLLVTFQFSLIFASIIETKLYDKEKLYYSLPLTYDDYLPAYKAALKSDLKKLKIMARMNINFDEVDPKTGETPLHAACRRGNVEVFRYICSRIKNFAPLNRNGRTPFSTAVSHGNREIVFMMLGYCTEFNCRDPDNYGRTPTMIAGIEGHKDIFLLLKTFSFN